MSSVHTVPLPVPAPLASSVTRFCSQEYSSSSARCESPHPAYQYTEQNRMPPSEFVVHPSLPTYSPAWSQQRLPIQRLRWSSAGPPPAISFSQYVITSPLALHWWWRRNLLYEGIPPFSANLDKPPYGYKWLQYLQYDGSRSQYPTASHPATPCSCGLRSACREGCKILPEVFLFDARDPDPCISFCDLCAESSTAPGDLAFLYVLLALG